MVNAGLYVVVSPICLFSADRLRACVGRGPGGVVDQGVLCNQEKYRAVTHWDLMRGREPRELCNKIRCNSIQLLRSRHGWRFKTHPVKIWFRDVAAALTKPAARYTATASCSQRQIICEHMSWRLDLLRYDSIFFYHTINITYPENNLFFFFTDSNNFICWTFVIVITVTPAILKKDTGDVRVSSLLLI